MSIGTNTPRLLAAAKEFNIGKDTLVEYLQGKEFEIDASKPNTKLTPEMYNALQEEFAQDKAAKRKSDALSLPRVGGVAETARKVEGLEENKPVEEEKIFKTAAPKKTEQPEATSEVEEIKEEKQDQPEIKTKEVEAEKPASVPAPEEKKEETPKLEETRDLTVEETPCYYRSN